MERTNVNLNGVTYRWPLRPVVVVCIDGGDPAYFDQCLQDGSVPNIRRFMADGFSAVAEGMTTRWLDVITAALATQPPDLTADAAVRGAFDDLGDGFAAISDQVRELAALTRSSPVFSAWTLQIYLRYEAAIAELPASLGIEDGSVRNHLVPGDGQHPSRALSKIRVRVVELLHAQSKDDVVHTRSNIQPGQMEMELVLLLKKVEKT